MTMCKNARKLRKFIAYTGMFAVVIFLLNGSLCASLSLGSFPPTKKTVILSPGESARIKLGFFNPGNDPVFISFSVASRISSSSYGPDLKVYFLDKNGRILSSIVLPGDSKTTNPTPGKDWYLLPDGRTYVEVVPVYVMIKVPDKPTFSRNRYRLLISAKAFSASSSYSHRNGIYQRIGQERIYPIDVIIKGVVPIGEMNIPQQAEVASYNTSSVNEGGSPLSSTITNKKEKTGVFPNNKKIKLSNNDKFVNPSMLKELQKNMEEKNENNGSKLSDLTGELSSSTLPVNTTTFVIMLLGFLGIIYVIRD